MIDHNSISVFLLPDISSRMKPVCLVALLLGLSFAGALGEVRLPAILSDHMILQRSPATRVWGIADPGEQGLKVWPEKIPAPIAMRYGWADTPTCNLYNGAGLPSAPFRTDNFPAAPVNAKF